MARNSFGLSLFVKAPPQIQPPLGYSAADVTRICIVRALSAAPLRSSTAITVPGATRSLSTRHMPPKEMFRTFAGQGTSGTVATRRQTVSRLQGNRGAARRSLTGCGLAEISMQCLKRSLPRGEERATKIGELLAPFRIGRALQEQVHRDPPRRQWAGGTGGERTAWYNARKAVSPEEPPMQERIAYQGITFDDVLLEP